MFARAVRDLIPTDFAVLTDVNRLNSMLTIVVNSLNSAPKSANWVNGQKNGLAVRMTDFSHAKSRGCGRGKF